MARARRLEEDNGSDNHEGIEFNIRGDRSSEDNMALRADEQPLLHGDGEDGGLLGGNTVARDDIDGLPKDPADGEEGGAATAGLFIWLLTLSAGLSGLLFGYDTGVISATLVSIGTALSGRDLTSFDKSIITSSTALFALGTSPLASVLADTRGRRHVIFAADALFVIGAVVQAASSSVPVMVVGRSVVGAAVGAASFVVPLYIAEAAPAAHRGRLITVNVLFITLGQVIAYVLGWLLAAYADPRTAWRWMVGLGAVPALLQAVLVLLVPESPRWLVKAGRTAEARAVIGRVHGGHGRAAATAAASSIVKTIETEVRAEAEAQRVRKQARRVPTTAGEREPWRFVPRWLRADGDTWAALLGVRRNRRALAIACLLLGLQQLCGFNSLMYFSATIFTLVGFDQPTLTALTVAATNFVFTVAALLLVDRIGRRRVLLYSIPLMALGLLLAAYGFSRLDLSVGDTNKGSTPPPSSSAASVVLVSIVLYVAAYAIGLGNVPWMQSELFALDVRSLGSGLATATNWLANFVIGLTFLPLMDALTPSWTFVLYAAICLAGFWLVRVCYPETSGLSLEAAASLLDADDWGVGRRRRSRA
ncbi:MFS transporter, SP family, solute carrier family 2 (myo-inositol transporter), member 13 [Sporothrix schenckii 1099-18]|uniref:MFS transporter, SP family, solute carrier family 2 (Myo-inositol transporter), member 13 n=1 Tax=Sporothrix schenckii 1099-18 TaxID=1397361 RepID=A0A0F2MBP6_SPOSC|nr:MFS transporter, SP family, solute carrier family 2 (myo-inositol transporter), member 13 [Sporothrix schenckii 1099-18]KJR87057.1 MFS transporter, SP family, solute carrier family 2 (myo-inositol transporter), member 13 [Sporothrix schenckii 1099-18]